AAGLAGFAIESARDLVQYMVRRGQMTQEEADKLMREAEEAYSKRPKPPAPKVADVPKVVAKTAEHHAPSYAPHVTHAAPSSHAAPAAKKAAPAPAKKAAKPAPKPASKSAKAAPKKSSKPASAASHSKAKPKVAAKKKK
ncbi:MAG: hypothetical protein M3Y05_12715, partial [Gemmatimonadota bacterium]|nr:hypothetical protein [Gemmatimonadota bacterium]